MKSPTNTATGNATRTVTYAAGWAALTILAGGVVWWGFGPLLAPIIQVKAAPPSPPVAVVSPPGESSPTVSAKPSPKRSSPAPSPSPSSYDGWQYIDGTFLRTFELEGGEATVRIVRGHVELASSRANSGYVVSSMQSTPERLVVRFDGPQHFLLDVIWWDNRPYAEITKIP